MLHACVIKIVAHDNALRIDAVPVSRSRAGKIEREPAILIKESVAVDHAQARRAKQPSPARERWVSIREKTEPRRRRHQSIILLHATYKRQEDLSC